ncbi:hypothetical protein QCA50_002525 [Cerrena zonata]|uniref:Uncharacterized protein n=1 Tax=Cerrena zonata TaxID=2478898 RepID=A0AAW0GZF6_9APHY
MERTPSEFPPSHWEVIEEQRVVVEDSEEPKNDPGISPPDDIPAEPEATQCSEESHPLDGSQTPSEPATLAQRIQTMLSSFPPFFATSPPIPTSRDPSNSASPSFVGETQRIPIPLFLSDSKLVSLLSSSSVMNGSADKDRPSVWSILDHLKAKVPGLTPPEENNGSNSKQKDAEILSPSSRRTDDDNSSVMLYAPLVPDDASEVEIARSEMLMELEPVSGTEQPKSGPSSEYIHVERPVPKRVWVPSSTKLSIQLNWWGYRLYLPPPVLAVLDNKRLESAKRAAIITTALKWALDHISGLTIPPQMHPVLTVLKSLIPYLGYVGGFVAWSWGAIKTFDKGNGVVLTATWLLPVALIPGTWEDDDYPEVVELQRGVSDSTTTPQP